MSSSSLGVLALQGVFIEHVRILRSLAQEQAARGGLAVTVVEVRKPSQVAGLSGLVIPGGESTTLSVFLRENDESSAFGKESPTASQHTSLRNGEYHTNSSPPVLDSMLQCQLILAKNLQIRTGSHEEKVESVLDSVWQVPPD